MSTSRNINPFEFFLRTAEDHRPTHQFTGRTRAQFSAWQKKTLPAVLATAGKRPASVPAKPELLVQWEEDGLIKERWILNTQRHLSVILLVFRPANLKRGEKRPAIFCSHGHGPHGKDPVMGLDFEPARQQAIRDHNYDYGFQMAKQGFVTYSIDWLGFGERDSRAKPHDLNKFGQRDACNVHYLCATMLGTTTMAINLHDARVVTDFVASQKYVDADNLGVMGLSYGGTMTTWLALDDKRYKAVNIICYSGPFRDIAFDTYNVCGSQLTPGLFDLVDTFDLQGLIAPRPLLVEIGVHDRCFQVDHSLNRHYRPLEKIYAAAGASDKLELDLHPNDHAWGGNRSVAFFRRHLNAQWSA
jgi:pimeloyl-ACP methyl ester carboxylesterase